MCQRTWPGLVTCLRMNLLESSSFSLSFLASLVYSVVLFDSFSSIYKTLIYAVLTAIWPMRSISRMNGYPNSLSEPPIGAVTLPSTIQS